MSEPHMAGLIVGVVMVQQATFSLDPKMELVDEKQKGEGAQWRELYNRKTIENHYTKLDL